MSLLTDNAWENNLLGVRVDCNGDNVAASQIDLKTEKTKQNANRETLVYAGGPRSGAGQAVLSYPWDVIRNCMNWH